jgi:prophage antirepressor-like protein
MEVVKAFSLNSLHKAITISGTTDNPLFRVLDIGEILNLQKIRNSIAEFDDTEKVVLPTATSGGIQNVTFLTEKGLYKVLFKSRTPMAEQFQNWVCDVIKELRLSGKYELEAEVKRLKQEQQRKLLERGDWVYIYEEILSSGSSVFKAGFTGSLTSRMVTYASSHYENNLRYKHQCRNGRLVESIVHHMLERFRDANKTEWFHTSFEVVKQAIITAQVFVDDCITCDDPLIILQKMQTITEIIGPKTDLSNVIETNAVPENETSCDNVQEIVGEQAKEPDMTRKMPPDDKVKRFIEEATVADENSTTSAVELTSTFRMWNKAPLDRHDRSALNKYLIDHYLRGGIFCQEKQTVANAFKGIRISYNITYNPASPPNNYDTFIAEECIIHPLAKIPTHVMASKFMEWKKNKGYSVSFLKKETMDMYRHLTQHFVHFSGSCIYNGQKEAAGFYGIDFKDSKLNAGFRLDKANRKEVYMIDNETREVVRKFASLSEASTVLNIDIYYRMKTQALHEGCYFSYTDPTTESQPVESSSSNNPYKNMSFRDLAKLARSRGLKVESRATKPELITLLIANDREINAP